MSFLKVPIAIVFFFMFFGYEMIVAHMFFFCLFGYQSSHIQCNV